MKWTFDWHVIWITGAIFRKKRFLRLDGAGQIRWHPSIHSWDQRYMGRAFAFWDWNYISNTTWLIIKCCLVVWGQTWISYTMPFRSTQHNMTEWLTRHWVILGGLIKSCNSGLPLFFISINNEISLTLLSKQISCEMQLFMIMADSILVKEQLQDTHVLDENCNPDIAHMELNLDPFMFGLSRRWADACVN